MLIYSADRISKETRSFQENNSAYTDTLKIKSLKSLISILCQPNTIDLSSVSLLFNKCNLKDEDFEASYVTLIKLLIRNADSNALNTFYYTTRNNFKFLKPLLKYSHHPDVMIKNASRIGLLTIFKKCTGEAMQCIKFVIVPQHVRTIISHLKKNALDIQNSSMKCNKSALEKACNYYEEELEYLDDLLNLNSTINEITVSCLLNDFISSFILTAIAGKKLQPETSTPIACRTGLYLLSKCFQKVTNATMRDILTELVLQNKKLLRVIDEKNREYGALLATSLSLILAENKLQVEALYTLYILHSVQSNISCDLRKNLKFYSKFLHVLIKFLMLNVQSNDVFEFTTLKLLGLCFEPLIQENEKNENWLKLRTIFAQSLEILYTDICKRFQQENIQTLASFVDKEYKIFINDKNSELSMNDASFLFKGNCNSNEVNDIKKAINYLFFVRDLCLGLKGLKEKILPIIKNKEIIGNILETADCIPCKKLTHGKVYMNNHFIKLTNRQLLVLQSAENEPESHGIIVFNSYYKDITWMKHTNYALSLYESHGSSELRVKEYRNKFCIQLNFCNFDQLHFMINFLTEAKKRQMQIVTRKLTDLFQL